MEPGLTVILVGDDAASSAYVNMKARTCEKLGFRIQMTPGDTLAFAEITL